MAQKIIFRKSSTAEAHMFLKMAALRMSYEYCFVVRPESYHTHMRIRRME